MVKTCAVLSTWLARFPEADETSHVFPYHRVGIGGASQNSTMWDVDLFRPVRDWKTAWRLARRTVSPYRWHDLRHTFISRLAENANVSEGTIRSLAGHVSQQMLQRYSHIRVQAKRDAITAMENQRTSEPGGVAESIARIQ